MRMLCALSVMSVGGRSVLRVYVRVPSARELGSKVAGRLSLLVARHTLRFPPVLRTGRIEKPAQRTSHPVRGDRSAPVLGAPLLIGIVEHLPEQLRCRQAIEILAHPNVSNYRWTVKALDAGGKTLAAAGAASPFPPRRFAQYREDRPAALPAAGCVALGSRRTLPST